MVVPQADLSWKKKTIQKAAFAINAYMINFLINAVCSTLLFYEVSKNGNKQTATAVWLPNSVMSIKIIIITK